MRSVFSVLLLAGLLAACSDAGGDASGDAAGDAPASESGTTAEQAAPAEPQAPFGRMPAPADTSRRAGTLGEPEHANQVMAVLTEWGIELSPDTIPAGEVRIAFENRGERPHTIEVTSTRAGRWSTLPIPPGGTVTLTMPMAPANFDVISTEEAYVERGMRATLFVR